MKKAPYWITCDYMDMLTAFGMKQPYEFLSYMIRVNDGSPEIREFFIDGKWVATRIHGCST